MGNIRLIKDIMKDVKKEIITAYDNVHGAGEAEKILAEYMAEEQTKELQEA